jgi:hypothetical protein
LEPSTRTRLTLDLLPTLESSLHERQPARVHGKWEKERQRRQIILRG